MLNKIDELVYNWRRSNRGDYPRIIILDYENWKNFIIENVGCRYEIQTNESGMYNGVKVIWSPGIQGIEIF